MKEPIFNLYFIINDGIIRGRAAVRYNAEGTDGEKMDYLQAHFIDGLEIAKRYGVPDGWRAVNDGKVSAGMSWDTYQEVYSHQFGDAAAFEDIFRELGAPEHPMMFITPVVDGEILIEAERAIR